MAKVRGECRGGLEVLTLRRSYKNRRNGSLADLAEEVYDLIKGGEMNLVKALNLNRASALTRIAVPRREEIDRRKADAAKDLKDHIDTRNLTADALVTARLFTADDLVGPG